MSRIALVLPSLIAGGAERVALTLAHEMSARGYQVDFVLQQAAGELLDQVPPTARVIDLKARRLRNVISPLRRYLQSEKPAGLEVSMWPLTVYSVIAHRLARSQSRLVLSDHNTLSRSYAAKGTAHKLVMGLTIRAAYPRAHGRVAVSRGVAEDLARLSGLDARCWTVVYNPIPAPSKTGAEGPAAVDLWGNGTEKRILTVGSLKPQKNQVLLVRAFAEVARARNAVLMIVGEGDERIRIEKAVAAAGLQDRVIMPGLQPNPWPFYFSADLFVLTSDYEGFGNVIVEALACGTPVVSTDCPSGPAEILRGGEFGTLVPVGDADALARAMEESLVRSHDLERLRARARDFAPEKAATTYLDLLGC